MIIRSIGTALPLTTTINFTACQQRIGLYTSVPFISPRRACAARVTVLDLCVCLSIDLIPRGTVPRGIRSITMVCLSICLSVYLSMTILGLEATRRIMSDTNSFSATRA